MFLKPHKVDSRFLNSVKQRTLQADVDKKNSNLTEFETNYVLYLQTNFLYTHNSLQLKTKKVTFTVCANLKGGPWKKATVKSSEAVAIRKGRVGL